MSSSARRVAWLIDTAYRCTSSSMYTRAVRSTRKPTSSSETTGSTAVARVPSTPWLIRRSTSTSSSADG